MESSRIGQSKSTGKMTCEDRPYFLERSSWEKESYEPLENRLAVMMAGRIMKRGVDGMGADHDHHVTRVTSRTIPIRMVCVLECIMSFLHYTHLLFLFPSLITFPVCDDGSWGSSFKMCSSFPLPSFNL